LAVTVPNRVRPSRNESLAAVFGPVDGLLDQQTPGSSPVQRGAKPGQVGEQFDSGTAGRRQRFHDDGQARSGPAEDPLGIAREDELGLRQSGRREARALERLVPGQDRRVQGRPGQAEAVGDQRGPEYVRLREGENAVRGMFRGHGEGAGGPDLVDRPVAGT
jgi:hypothetical protein